ncbi:MAG: TraB/GumN family protein [Leptospiraceae bacterium]|nr:TraB/GumN family protein [Leptospiraceae bacterium]
MTKKQPKKSESRKSPKPLAVKKTPANNGYSIELRRLKLGKTEVILLGTAHVSRESVEDVQRAIEKEKPDSVLIELDDGRAKNLRDPDHWKHMDIVKVIRSGKIYLLFSSILLSIFQKKMGDRLTSAPGEEFRRAIEISSERGIAHHFIDREIRITLKRAWQSVGWWGKMRLMSELLASLFVSEKMEKDDIENLKEKDALQSVLDSLPPSFRRIREIIIDERDQYMAQKVRELTLDAKDKPKRALVVIGAGHLRGIEEALQNEHDLAKLTHVKPPQLWKSIAAFLLPIVIIAGALSYFTLSGNKKLDIAQTLKTWIIIKCSVTAVITAIWSPHILAYIAAVAVSPVSTFLPIIKSGWVAALLEAIFRKPEVTDFESMPEATSNFRSFYRNRIFRIFAIFFLGQFSSFVGYWVFIWYVKRGG